ncbi:agmatine deiminase family protein [Streptomyces sp. H10-C2]|uniref:agmatine deiminase family protein n=1 Tax=unclassified Streptomyces TaxID=2593676 RepID=UPI0024B90E6C|nr:MULTISPECIES: agmatine deiminase family protein [unclassified Streptomyces]MDJ0347140.1 agmatine deiminase family protein [Streptomyces sp. PH10-H1]MDJ0375386.1 agmatine deiminase family protein [Streptomyces sp. H10-C2]
MSRRNFLNTAALTAAATAAATVTGVGAGSALAATFSGTTYTVPGEWAPHSRCIMAFPWDASDGWGQKLHLVQDEVANIARQIARFEPVTMVAKPGTASWVQQQVGSTVTVIEYPINDCWTRDTMAIFGLDGSRKKLLGLDFRFNGWGNKYPFDKDDFLPVGVCQYLGVPRLPVDMVLEGGSVIQDGEGTIIGTEECLLNPNRNPGMTKAQIEAALLQAFGATKMIWLPYGMFGDSITNGHIDLVAAYVGPAKLLINIDPDPNGDNYQRLNANKQVLQASTDACGRSFQLVEMRNLPRFTVGIDRVITFSYTNYYPTAGGIVVPIANNPSSDNAALTVIQGLYPGKQVIGALATTLAWGGGGVHCITQQVPAVS